MTPPPPQKAGGSLRCRQCGARLSSGDEWCSLCLTPTSEPEPEPEPVVQAPSETPQGRHARAADPRDAAAVEARAQEMLAGLAADEAAVTDRSVFAVIKAHLALGQLPGGRYAVAFGATLLLLVLLMGGLTALGMLL
ncbi:hypothetical protein [Kineosporia babensis]|uniref:Uncharacterized protein n=1 Tax=Kineosporia babensis TaxID=499548 RepID=A0A9X1NCE1_9ACTN|nr:hypothetical protein [Kineosporia babensis]MCD5311525.1 hypothetical protein [Kineosporia babensis]